MKPVPSDAFAAIFERNLFGFQGHPADGVFENGTVLATRLRRCAGGRVALNGGGKVFRNFLYLPNRSFTAGQLLWMFKGALDPEWCTGAFDENVYLSNLGKKVKCVLDVESDRLTHTDIEAL